MVSVNPTSNPTFGFLIAHALRIAYARITLRIAYARITLRIAYARITRSILFRSDLDLICQDRTLNKMLFLKCFIIIFFSRSHPPGR